MKLEVWTTQNLSAGAWRGGRRGQHLGSKRKSDSSSENVFQLLDMPYTAGQVDSPIYLLGGLVS